MHWGQPPKPLANEPLELEHQLELKSPDSSFVQVRCRVKSYKRLVICQHNSLFAIQIRMLSFACKYNC